MRTVCSESTTHMVLGQADGTELPCVCRPLEDGDLRPFNHIQPRTQDLFYRRQLGPPKQLMSFSSFSIHRRQGSFDNVTVSSRPTHTLAVHSGDIERLTSTVSGSEAPCRCLRSIVIGRTCLEFYALDVNLILQPRLRSATVSLPRLFLCPFILRFRRRRHNF